jgi:hypothetical protein
MQKQAKEKTNTPGEVICINDAGRKFTRRDVELIAEAVCKDFPSQEARAFIDAQHDSEPQTLARDGDLMARALDSALDGNHLGYATISAAKLRAKQLKAGLGYADASTAEQMLIEHAVLCYARLGVVERLHAYATRGSHDPASGIYWDRRLTMAQKRFDRAMTTLARTRALLARAEMATQTASKLRAVGTRAA